MSKDYEVGYGKPPKANQFPPGQSGNRNGRPKGSRNKPKDKDYLSLAKMINKEASIAPIRSDLPHGFTNPHKRFINTP